MAKSLLFRIADDVFTPDKVLEMLDWARRDVEFVQPEDVTGYRTPSRIPAWALRRLEKAFGLEIDRRSVKAPSAEERFNRGCGCIYYGLAEGMHAEVPTIHWDDPPDFLTAVVYLSDGPASAGTAWYRHKPTGLYACPTKADAVNHGYDDNAAGLCQFKDDIDADTPMLSLWEMQGFAALKPGRAVLYRSGMFHRATEHFGACKMDGRLYWTLRFAEKR